MGLFNSLSAASGPLHTGENSANNLPNGLTRTATSIVPIDICSTGPGTLNVTGAATFDGTLNAGTVGGFAAGLVGQFDVETYGSSTGAFASLNSGGLGAGKFFDG